MCDIRFETVCDIRFETMCDIRFGFETMCDIHFETMCDIRFETVYGSRNKTKTNPFFVCVLKNTSERAHAPRLTRVTHTWPRGIQSRSPYSTKLGPGGFNPGHPTQRYPRPQRSWYSLLCIPLLRVSWGPQ